MISSQSDRAEQAVPVDGCSRVRLAANSFGARVNPLTHMARYGYRLLCRCINCQ